MKIKKLFLLIYILSCIIEINAFAADDTGNKIISEVIKNMNKTFCNQYLISRNHYFVKICPYKYQEIDIDYDVDQDTITYVFSPAQNNKFITKYELKEFIRQSGLEQYFHFSKNKLNKLLEKTDLIEKIILRHNNIINMDIRYVFLILKFSLKSEKIKPEDIKYVWIYFSKIISNDKDFILKNAYENNKIYIPEHKWIYDRIKETYYKKLSNYTYIKITLKPFTIIKIASLKSLNNKNIQKEIKQFIEKYKTQIQTIVNGNNYIKIILRTQLNRKQIENNVFNIF